jgi:predicted dehydrogenase
VADLGVGVIGIGDICSIYLQNLALFKGVRVVAVAGRNALATAKRAKQFDVEGLTPDELITRDDIGIVVNLTPPAAHADITMDALTAGKHVYSEKPLATQAAIGRALVKEAGDRGLLLGCAPDTFLGAGGRLARTIVDAGEIGKILSGTCMFMSHGMEHWHPNPDFFFKSGGGPVLDIGPYYLTTLVNLLGPISSVQAEASSGFKERLVTASGSQSGQRIRVETPTTVLALLTFESGAVFSLMMSWDVWKHDHRPIELYGTEGSMVVPDPDTYGGPVLVSHRGGPWESRTTDTAPFGFPNWRPAGAPPTSPASANYRGIGIAELASAVSHNTSHRSSGALGCHVLCVMEGILTAASERRSVAIDFPLQRPEGMSESEATDLETM